MILGAWTTGKGKEGSMNYADSSNVPLQSITQEKTRRQTHLKAFFGIYIAYDFERCNKNIAFMETIWNLLGSFVLRPINPEKLRLARSYLQYASDELCWLTENPKLDQTSSPLHLIWAFLSRNST